MLAPIVSQDRSSYGQMEYILRHQHEKLEYYKSYFTSLGNETMASKLEAHIKMTLTDIDTLYRDSGPNKEVPKYKFDHVEFSCVPTNVDVKEKELQVSIQTTDLTPTSENSLIYAIAEFEFPVAKDETFTESIARWWHAVYIEPKRLIVCSSEMAKQLDIIYSTTAKPFYDPDSQQVIYDRPLKFFVDKGKSRTLKRKYKPIKLTFYEKTNFLNCDKKLGAVQIRVDAINEQSTIVQTKVPIMDGRKQLDASAEITIRVREPLVEKAVKVHKEKLLVLT